MKKKLVICSVAAAALLAFTFYIGSRLESRVLPSPRETFNTSDTSELSYWVCIVLNY